MVVKPDLAMPWPAWYDLSGDLPATVALSVSPDVLPSQIPLYIEDIRGHEGHNLSLSLQLIDDRYGREVQIRDLAQRGVRAGGRGEPDRSTAAVHGAERWEPHHVAAEGTAADHSHAAVAAFGGDVPGEGAEREQRGCVFVRSEWGGADGDLESQQ